MHIHTFASKEEASSQLTQSLNAVLKNIQQESKSVLFLVSAGSAYDLLSSIDVSAINENVTIGVLDERYSTDPKENNFALFMQTAFYNAIKEKGTHFIDTTVQNGEAHEAHAKRFEQSLLDWKKNNPDGVIVATVGIGPDGHTSGMMPFLDNPPLFAKMFEDPERLVAHYDADGKNPYRYRTTTTNTFLRKYIDYSFVYAVGANKKDALIRLVAESGSLAETPARVLREMKHVELFTDVSLE